VLGPRVDFEVGSSSRVCCVTQPKNCRTQNISRLLWEICVILMKQWVDITHLMAEYCEKPFFFRRLSHWTWLLPGRISWLDWRLMMVVYIYIIHVLWYHPVYIYIYRYVYVYCYISMHAQSICIYAQYLCTVLLDRYIS
jgi:hypothetical protein